MEQTHREVKGKTAVSGGGGAFLGQRLLCLLWVLPSGLGYFGFEQKRLSRQSSW